MSACSKSFLSVANWSDNRTLLCKALYRILVRGSVRDYLIEELGVMKEIGRVL